MASDRPRSGSIEQQKMKTGLKTWLRPGSKVYPRERDKDGAERRLS